MTTFSDFIITVAYIVAGLHYMFYVYEDRPRNLGAPRSEFIA